MTISSMVKTRRHLPRNSACLVRLCMSAVIMDATDAGPHGGGCRGSRSPAGVEALRETVRAAIDFGLDYLTVYSFSMENWNRPSKKSPTSWVCLTLYPERSQ